MGEVAASSDQKDMEGGTSTAPPVVRWERFMPRTFLRVLLVEADDSTRQIIAALLRKCNYKVAAVGDGLKAWETLQEKARYIDLVLTEIELPSISGFCLLTMIMEHETCKSIPVIMMSSQDSISTVFKCMMRGAADFLVKPIRKNELRNLWQHVWRRQSSKGVLQEQLEVVHTQQKKLDAISENNAASNHSSDNIACRKKKADGSDKGSDTQSSCAKPDIEDDSHMENMQEEVHPFENGEVHKCERGTETDSTFPMTEKANYDTPTKLKSGGSTYGRLVESAERTIAQNLVGMATDECQGRITQSCAEVIDLIGAIDNQAQHPQTLYSTSAVGGSVGNCVNIEDSSPVKEIRCKSSPLPFLELSLRSLPSASGNNETEKKHRGAHGAFWNHSNGSAFSRYNNKTIQPHNSGQTNVLSDSYNIEHKEKTCVSQKSLSNQSLHYSSEPHWAGAIPVPVPMLGGGYDGLNMQPMLLGQSGTHLWSMSSGSQQEGANEKSSHGSSQEAYNYQENHPVHDQTAPKLLYKPVPRQEQLESAEEPIRAVSVTAQSGSGGLCNGSKGYLNSSGCGSVCNGSNTNVSPLPTAAESGTDEGPLVNGGLKVVDYPRSSQREAALTKFRLKRKDRCFEKKVRYQSRKRLAEQRPRVKGQFVRQVQSSP